MTRAHRSFWVLVLVTTVAMGTLSRALARPPGTTTGVAVVSSGVVLVVAGALALRILLRAGTPSRTEGRDER